MGNLVDNARKGLIVPHDQYSHAASLLRHDTESVNDFTQLLRSEILLANIGTDQMLRFYQIDAKDLTALFSMSKRDESVKLVFNQLYFTWVWELSMTRTLGGTERHLQASAAGYAPSGMSSGFGDQFLEEQETNKKQSILDKTIGKLTKGGSQPKQRWK